MEKYVHVEINGNSVHLSDQQVNSVTDDCVYSCIEVPDNSIELIPAETLINCVSNDGNEDVLPSQNPRETVYIQDISGVYHSALVVDNQSPSPLPVPGGGPNLNAAHYSLLNVNPLVLTNKNIILSGGMNITNEISNIEGNKTVLQIVNQDSVENINCLTYLHIYNVRGVKKTVALDGPLSYLLCSSGERTVVQACREIFEFCNDLTLVFQPERPSGILFREELDDIQLLNRRVTVLTQPGSTIQEMKDCHFCGFSSPDSEVCQRCRRSLTYKVKCESEKESSTTPEKGDNRRRKCSKKAKKTEEPPECIAISSDEEDNVKSKGISNGVTFQQPTTSVFEKEPVITADTEGSENNFPDSLRGGGIEMESLLDSLDTEKAALDCRSVRFGTYKAVPDKKIIITEHGLKMKVPPVSKTGNSPVIKILMKDIVKVLVHFGNAPNSTSPTMFYYVTYEASKKIREALHMKSKKDHFFDPTSKEELHKRITILPEKISEEQRLFIKSIYESRCLMEEITWEEANDILVRAAPKDIQQDLKKDKHIKAMASSSQSSTPTTSSAGIQIIMVYPPPPAKGGISINTEDYACLKEDQFLNDVIIDFYLKYLWLNVLSEEDRKRTHIFSSFFYKRLTMCPPRQSGTQENQKLTPAEKRHARVKGWTKSVDIFEKDFIIIPINEKSHWFLGIICFPGLNGPVRTADNQPVPNATSKKKSDASVLAGGLTPAKIYGTTITVVAKDKILNPKGKAPTISLIDPDEDRDGESERDEAEADDDDMEPNTTDEESGKDDDLMDEATPRIVAKLKALLDPIKQPCILIFDSLQSASRSRVCATLREYLEIEWKVRHRGRPRDFSKNVFKGAVPKVPQQTNYIDCGVYLLQYVEAFFKNPITDYRMPIRSIKEWFTTEEVNRKRYDIMQLLLSLMKEQNVDIPRLNLPFLNLTPYSHYDGDEEEVMEEGEFDEGVEEGEEEPMCEEEEDEEDEDEERFKMEELFDKAKRYEQHSRLEQQQMRLETQPRLDQLPRSEVTSSRLEASRMESGSLQQLRAEAIRNETIRSRISEQVTICEASSKRKLPISLKDIRSPRLLSPQTSIEKVKKMRVE